MILSTEKFTPIIAYLGPEASFTHIAATYLFGKSAYRRNQQFQIVLKRLVRSCNVCSCTIGKCIRRFCSINNRLYVQ